MAYILYFNFKEKVCEFPLPPVNNRTISIDISQFSGEKGIINFEIFDSVWRIVKSDDFIIMLDKEPIEEKELSDGDTFIIKQKRGNLQFALLALRTSENTTEYRKWKLSGVNAISIGKDSDCNIVYVEKLVSHKHALLKRNGANFVLVDSSTNGTFLNGKKVNGEVTLKIFDTIYIFGLKIIYLGDYIATNKILEVNTTLEEAVEFSNEYAPFEDNSNFSRSPRRTEPLDSELIEIEAPPSKQKLNNQPLIFIIGPSVTMPLPIMISVIINLMSSGGNSNPLMYLGTVISVVCSGFIGAGWALAHQIYNKKTVKKEEKNRVEAYGAYIDKNERLLTEKQGKNKRILSEQFLSSDDLMSKILSDRTSLWNRNFHHSDFTRIRLGTGKVKLPNEISVPKERFSMTDDELADKPRELYDKYKMMEDCAYTCQLNEQKIWGVIGDHDKVSETVKNIAIQLSALHCYTDVKIALFCKENERENYMWMKWLPHIFSPDRKVRMFASDSISNKNVCDYLGGELRSREERVKESDSEKALFLPLYFVICTDKSVFEKSAINKYITNNQNLGFVFILAYEQMDKLPNECKVVIQNDRDYSGVYMLSSAIDETNSVKFDSVNSSVAERYARAVNGYYVTEFGNGEIPVSVDYLDMLGIGRYEQWNLIRKYKENRSYESISSLIGVGTGNRPVYLDISEKMHGPHGLIAGTTGSGKSETIQTFILSLILNYSPDEVAFILIDYKGGGMAAAFDGIPHLAGIITNLGDSSEDGAIDENLTRRALISIKSEIKRRQKIFNRYKVNHINQYIKLYRNGDAEEALPHLIIISDEFAELKREQPEFIKELVSTARVGRSLGVHLILATQKPAGVVDDEIWSNSRFKICLKVQDKQDSIGMLKRSEAAYLVNTGRAYMQVGNDEIFEMFQSGYSGAEYYPSDEYVSAKDKEVVMIDLDGSVIEENAMSKNGISSGISQLKAGIDYVIEISEKYGIKPTRKLWKECLPSLIGLEKIDCSNIDFSKGLISVFGMVDNPERQDRYPAVIDISKTSNILVLGMAGSGKSTLLHTFIYSLATHYSPDEFQFYFLDFSSRTARKFEKLPHCGGVVLQENAEHIERLFKLIDSEMSERRKIFDEKGVGGWSEYVKSGSMPMILVVIDNYVAFAESYPEISEKLFSLSWECLKYGIQFVFSQLNTNGIPMKIRQNIGNYITLRLPGKYDYSDSLGGSPDFVPSKYIGRGIIKEDGLLEFQTAVPFEISDETERTKYIINEFENIAEKYKDCSRAKKIPVIPRNESYAEFYEKNKSALAVPVGYNTDDIGVISEKISDMFCLAVGANEVKSISLVFNNFIYAAQAFNAEIWYFKTKTDILCSSDGITKIYNSEDIAKMLNDLQINYEKRSEIRGKYKNSCSEALLEEKLIEEMGMLYIFIDDMAEFCNIVYSTSYEEEIFSFVEETFKYGAHRGVCFIAGFESNRYGDTIYKDACKNFLMNKAVIHLGGQLGRQKLFVSSLSYSQQEKILDYNVGHIYDGTSERQIFIPLSEKED